MNNNFKPLNSSESNLYSIRINTPLFNENNILNSTMISDLYNDPPFELLPYNFNIQIDTINQQIIINYGNIKFTSNPTITIFPIASQNYNIIITSINNTNNTFSFKIYNGLNNLENPLTINIAFSILIIGPTLIGPNYITSNKGWNLNDKIQNEQSVFTYLPVGVGTANTQTQLSIKGNISIQPFKKQNISEFIDDTILRSNYINLLNLNDEKTIQLQKGYNGQMIKIYIIQQTLSSNFLKIEGNNVAIYGLLQNGTVITQLLFNTIGKNVHMIYNLENNTWIIMNNYGFI